MQSQYKDSGSIDKIKEVTNNSLRYGLDAISEQETQKFSVQTFGVTGGKLVNILDAQKEAQELRPDVTIQSEHVSGIRFVIFTRTLLGTLIYTSLGRTFTLGTSLFPASPEDRDHMAQFLQKVPELVESGQISPNPTKLLQGGLEGINAGLQYMMEGKNSGEKIVYRVSN